MNGTRMWTLGSIVVIIAVLAGSWFIGISPRLDEAALANSDRTTVEAQNRVHEATLASLKEQSEGLDALKAELELAHRAVPTGANLSDLIRQVNNLAAAAGVKVSQLTVGDPVPFMPVEEATTDPELSSALGSVNAENFLVIQVGINLTGDYQNVMKFVNGLQLGERLILVHSLDLGDGQAVTGAAVEFSLTGQMFVLLDEVPATEDAVTEMEPEAAAG